MEHTTSPFSRRARRATCITFALAAFAMITSVAVAAPKKAGAEAAATATSAQSAPTPKAATAEEKPASDDTKSKTASKKANKTTAKARPKVAAKTAEEPPAAPSASPTTEPAAPAIVPRLVLPTAPVSAAPRDCNLLTQEAPRGGQLEVQGPKFGASPVVRVGNQVTRILRRERDKISVQIPADSNGGAVTVQVAGQKQDCGALTIIGKNRD